MRRDVADVKVDDRAAFVGVCSCGWSGYRMFYREDAKLEAMMHADFSTLREAAHPVTTSEPSNG